MNIRLNKILVLVLVLALMSTTVYALPNMDRGRGPENAPGFQKNFGTFNDLGEFIWAERYIERMAKKDVIKGVGNGAFMPGGTAKEIETIIMLLRELGYEDELDEDAVLPEEYNGKKPGDWMVPYIELANEKGLITVEEMDTFDPNFPTKRSKAAVYFVRAVGMEEEALENNDRILEFRDFNAIPKEHVGYVYVAYQIGLIQGYPDKNFQPNKAINRAELAAMMSRLDDEFDTDFSYSLIAKIENIDIDSMQITLKYRGNENIFDLLDDVDVYIDNESEDLADLAVNMIVKVYIENDEIIEISFRSDKENKVTKRYEGEVIGFTEDFDEITIEGDSSDLTFAVTSETKIHVPVLEDTLIKEFVELNAKVIADNTTATSIWIELNKVEGILIGINTSGEAIVSVDVQLDESTTKNFVFYDDFEICIDEVEGDLTDEYLGHIVEMKLLGNDHIVTLCVESEVSTEYLEELVEDAEELFENNYTAASWITFKTALTEAGIVLDKDDPTQEEVYTKYTNLADKMKNLIATVTDLVVDEDVVKELDNTDLEITVASGTTVGELEDSVESEFNASFTVLDDSNNEVTDEAEVTDTMVLEITAEDDTTVVEYNINVQ